MLSLKKYFWVVHLFFLAIMAFFASQALSVYLTVLLEGSSQSIDVADSVGSSAFSDRQDLSAYSIIFERDFFNSEEVIKEELVEEEAPVERNIEGPAVKTSLSIKLLGVIVVGDGKNPLSSATIEGGKGRKADVYTVGGKESFLDGVELVQIKKDRIEFINKGRLEYALLQGLDEGESSIFKSPEEVHGKVNDLGKSEESTTANVSVHDDASGEDGGGVLDQAEIDEALNNMDRLFTEIKIIPNMKRGKAEGMKILAVKPNSIFSKLGLKRGDILMRINGMDLDIKSGMQLFSQLRSQKSFKLDLVRRGKKKTFEYEIR